MKFFISPKSPFPYLSFSLCYHLNTHYPLPPLPFSLSFFLLKILPLFASSYLVNLPEISAIANSLLGPSCFHPLCPVWYDHLAPIQYAFSDPTQYDPILSLIFYPLTKFLSDYVYSVHSNPIQYACLLFTDLLSPLRSLELLVLLKITYH